MRRLRILGCLVAAFSMVGAVTALAVDPAGSPGRAQAAAEDTTLTADPMPTWQTDGIVWSVAHANGVVYAGGVFSNVRPPGAAPGEQQVARKNFAAFDAATGELLPCAPAFTGGTGSVRAMKPSPDGEVLYVGGSFGTVTTGGEETAVSNAVAFDTADCTLRDDFRPGVAATVRAVDATADAVYLGGDFPTVDGQPRQRIAALSPAGALLPFRATVDKAVRAVTAAPEHGKIIIGGDFNTVNGASVHALVSLDPASGNTNQTFPGWIEPRSVVKALNRDDTNFYLGAEGDGHKVFDGRIAASLTTGARKWTDICYGATQAVVPYRGALYSGSHAHNCEDTPGGFPDNNIRQHLLANSIADSSIQIWFPQTNGGLGEQLGPRAMVMAGDILWTGGEFTTVHSKPQQSLTRFPAAPDTGAPQVPVLSGESTTAGKVRLSWKASWDRDDPVLTYRIIRDGEFYKSVDAQSRYWDRPTMGMTDTVPSNSTHRYSLEVTDGDNLSGRNGPVSVTAR
ncbi:MAG: fibronectin type III domain-containing protein [Streptomyces sp.]